jgi:hypothetical protein
MSSIPNYVDYHKLIDKIDQEENHYQENLFNKKEKKSMFNFEKVDGLPANLHKGKYSEITEYVMGMEPNQWIKIGGFDTITKMETGARSLYWGKYSASSKLKKLGFDLEYKTNRKELVLYVRKLPIKEA